MVGAREACRPRTSTLSSWVPTEDVAGLLGRVLFLCRVSLGHRFVHCQVSRISQRASEGIWTPLWTFIART